ncbi:UNVERIFIED_CONTAM: hypothetical protein GTU68_055278 [Idotea baltica]|nr:hypothetical protein [Idotea baltica]
MTKKPCHHSNKSFTLSLIENSVLVNR